MTPDLWHDLAWLGGQLVGVIFVAALVNRVAKSQRPRIRRVITLFALYAITYGLAVALPSASQWSHRFYIAADLFRAISVINMVGLTVFLVLLPLVGMRLPMIAGDLIVGVAYIVTTVVLLTRHGLDPSSVVATGAVVSAVLAISLQATLGNILGGVALQLDGSINEGDFIQLENGRQGRVRTVRWRHTIVDTVDSSTIIVPNAQLLGNNITILVGRNSLGATRVWVHFMLDQKHSPARVIESITESLARSPLDNVASVPEPTCLCADINKTDGFASYAVRYYVVDITRREVTDSLVRARIHAALLRAEMPLPTKSELVRPTSERNLATLRTVALFADCPDESLQQLANTATHAPYATGETILRQGSRAKSLFVLVSGVAEVHVRHDPDADGPIRERVGHVATLRAPDFFGEQGIVTGELRGADVVAKSDVECLCIGREPFLELLEREPAIAAKLKTSLELRKSELGDVRGDLDDAPAKGADRERLRDGLRKFFGL